MRTIEFELDGQRVRVYLNDELRVFVDAKDFADGKHHAEEYLQDFPEVYLFDRRPAWTERQFFHILFDNSAPDDFGFQYLANVLPMVREVIRSEERAAALALLSRFADDRDKRRENAALQDEIKAAGLTQNEIARALDMAPIKLSQYLTGKKVMPEGFQETVRAAIEGARSGKGGAI